jgi:hypothetical protein
MKSFLNFYDTPEFELTLNDDYEVIIINMRSLNYY